MAPPARPRLVYLTAGAGGMYCGSCLHDNALVRALRELGWDALLTPLYTPIRTDEEDASLDQVFFGGINVYLQQKVPVFRWLPRWLDRWLDRPSLLRRVTSRAIETDARVLGDLTISMLQGMDGRQRKEVRRLIQWMNGEGQPDIVIVTNMLVSGFIPEFKRQRSVPLLVTLQGDDVFLDKLPAAAKSKSLQLIRRNAEFVDGFIVHSRAFASRMAEYFDLPADRLHVTPLGIDTRDFEHLTPATEQDASQPVIGYLARLAPEKGLHRLVEAFIRLRQQPRTERVQLRIAGWLGDADRDYAEQQWSRLREAGLESDYEYLGVLTRQEKLAFLSGLSMLSVPTVQQEPKGLFALEAMAAGVPVVLPAHGAFPELIESSRGGCLFSPGDVNELTDILYRLLNDPVERATLGRSARAYVLTQRNQAAMARATSQLLHRFLSSS